MLFPFRYDIAAPQRRKLSEYRLAYHRYAALASLAASGDDEQLARSTCFAQIQLSARARASSAVDSDWRRLSAPAGQKRFRRTSSGCGPNIHVASPTNYREIMQHAVHRHLIARQQAGCCGGDAD